MNSQYKYKNCIVHVEIREKVQDDYRQLFRTSNSLKAIINNSGSKETKESYGIQLKNLRQSQLSKRNPSYYEYFVHIELTDMRYRNFSENYRFTVIDNEKFSDTIERFRRQTIQNYRTQNYSKYKGEKSFLGDTKFLFHGNKLTGRVFAKKGQILEYYTAKNIQHVYETKLPEQKNKYVGIEIEFCSDIQQSDLALKLFKTGVHKFVHLKDDGSLRPKGNERGYEMAILLKEATFRTDLKRITDILTEIKAKVEGRRCGLHVHLDMRNRRKDLVYSNMVACQDILLGIVDPSRHNNEFCTSVSSKKFPTNFTGERRDRYKTINAAAYYKYKTIEIRMHQGTVDFDEIANWTSLLIKLANYKKVIKGHIYKLTTLQKTLKVKGKLKNYMIDKTCYFQIYGSSGLQPVLARTPEFGLSDEPASVPSIPPPSFEGLRSGSAMASLGSLTYSNAYGSVEPQRPGSPTSGSGAVAPRSISYSWSR